MIPSFGQSLQALRNSMDAQRASRQAGRRRRQQARKHPLAAQQESLEARQLLTAIQVTTDADSGAGSLREAIATANANQQADTITFASGVTNITLTGGELVLSETGATNRTTIKGPVSISGNDASRIFTVKPGVFAALSSLTLTNGRSTGDGGAIVNQGGLELIGTTVKDSFATGKSGAIQLTSGTLDIVNSTLSGNRANQWGGAIGADDGRLTISSSTLTKNTADADANGSGDGGAISYPPKVVASLFNSILAGNTRASGTADDITGGANLHKDSSNNLIGNSSITLGLTHGTNGNQLGNGGSGVIDINTVLDTTLKDNGGGTLTHALVAASPALDAGDARYFRTPVIVDQRNQPRVDGDGIDIGAVETVVATAPNIVDVDGVRFVSTGNFNRPLTKFTAAGDAIIAVGGGNVAGHTPVTNALDGNPDTKYFQDSWTSAPGLTITPASGSSTVAAFRLTTADDVPDRDPASYKLEGASSPSGPFTLIAEGAINLPSARKTAGSTITFNNSTAYTSYRLTFPSVKGSSTTQFQISEVELLALDASRPNDFESTGSVQIGQIPTGAATFVPLLQMRAGARITTNSSGASVFSTTGLISTLSQGRSLDLMSGVVDGDANQRILIPVKSLTSGTGYAISETQANTFRLSSKEAFTPSVLTFGDPIRDITGPGDTVKFEGGGQIYTARYNNITYGPSRLFDNNLADGVQATSVTSDFAFIITPAVGQTVVNGVRFTSGGYDNYDPVEYKLEGASSPNGPWTAISDGSPALPTRSSSLVTGPVVNFANTTAYTSYRVTLSKIRSSSTLSFEELELLGTVPSQIDTVSLNGTLRFDALGGAGVAFAGADQLAISASKITAAVENGAKGFRPNSSDKNGKPAPTNFDLVGMKFEAQTMSSSYDLARREFRFEGKASTILDAGRMEVSFGGGVAPPLSITNGNLNTPSGIDLLAFEAAGISFAKNSQSTSRSDLFAPGDTVASFGGAPLSGNPVSNAIDGADSVWSGPIGTGVVVTPSAALSRFTAVDELRIRTSTGTPSNDPIAFTIAGSHSPNGPWEEIASEWMTSRIPTDRSQWYTHKFATNNKFYTSYRIVFDARNRDATPNFEVSEIQLAGQTRPGVLIINESNNTATVHGAFTAKSASIDLGDVGFGVDANPGDSDTRIGTSATVQNGAISSFKIPLTGFRFLNGKASIANQGTQSADFMWAEFLPAKGEIAVTGKSQLLAQKPFQNLEAFRLVPDLSTNGISIANGKVTDFTVPVKRFDIERSNLAAKFPNMQFVRDAGNSLDASYDAQRQTLALYGRGTASLSPEVSYTDGSVAAAVSTPFGLGTIADPGLLLNLGTPAQSAFSYSIGDFDIYGQRFRNVRVQSTYVPGRGLQHSGTANWVNSSPAATLTTLSRNSAPFPSFEVRGSFVAGGLQISTNGLEIHLRNGYWSLGENVNLPFTPGTTIQVEGKAAAVAPIDNNRDIFFDIGSSGLIVGHRNPTLVTPLALPIAGINLKNNGGSIRYPNTNKNNESHFTYTTNGKTDFQVGDIKTQAQVTIPLHLKNGGLVVGNGTRFDLDGTTIQNIVFKDGDLRATYSEQERRYVFRGTGKYLGLADVTIGGDPKNAQLSIKNGTWELTNFTPPVVDVVAAGVTFPTQGLTRSVAGDIVTFSGSRTVDVGGALITVALGGGGTNGLVVNIQTGVIQEISGTLSGTFTVGGVEISASGTMTYVPASKELRITGEADFAFQAASGPVNIKINLGHGGTPGLVIKDGQVQSVQASISASFKLFGLEVDVQNAGVSYDRAKQEYGFFGSVALSTPAKGGQRFLDNFSVTLGAPDTPGLVIKNGELEHLDIELNGSINLFGINATPESLRVVYTRSSNRLALTGGLTVTVAGKFKAKAAFPGDGLLIDTQTGEVQIRGLELRVQDVTFGTLEIRDLGFIYEVDSQGNTTISGSGEITLPAGLTVGAEVVVRNNRLKKIGFKVERSPGIPLGHPPVVFLNSIEGEIDNLDDLDNFQIKAKVTGTVGPSVKIFGQTRALVTVEGSIDINKDRMIIRGDVDLLEGIMGEGTGSITIFFKGKEVVDVSASFSLYPGGIFRGNMSFKMDRDFNITLNANLGFFVPDPVPVVGGESLGNFGIYLQIRPTERRENSYVRVSGDVTLAEFEVTVNFAGRVEGYAEALFRKNFGFYLPGARDLDFLLPLNEGNFDAIDAFTEVPAPELAIDGFTADGNGPGATVTYTGTSQLPADTTIDLFVDTVDSGFNGQLIAGGLAFQDGQQTYNWADMAAFASVPYDPNQKLYVYGLINDGSNIPVYTGYSAAITPPNLTPTISLPTEQTFGANQPLVFSTNTSNAVTVADPLAAHDADAELVVTLHTGNGFLTLDPQKATPWQNISDPNDVDDDGETSVSDALQIITMLNMDSMQGDDGTLPMQRSSIGGSGFYDVNGDGKVTSEDAQGLTDSLLNGTSTTVTTTVFDNVEVTGDGTGSVTLIGTAANINNVLDGLTYDPIENAFFEDSFSVSVNRYPEFYIERLTESVALKPRALTVGSADGVEFMPVSYEQGSGHAFLLEDVQIESAAAGYINSATIAIDGFEAGKDVLELNILDQQQLGITAKFDAAKGVLHLTGFGRIDEYRQAIGLVSFCSHGTGERTLRVKLGDRASHIGEAGVKVRITAINQAPIVVPGMGATYITGSGSSSALLPSISVRDTDSATLESATITLDAASFKEGEDVLSYVAADGITGTFHAMSGRLELRGTASAADYSAALLRVQYRNTASSATTGIREITIVVSDGNAHHSSTTVQQRLLVASAHTTLQGVTLGGLPTEALTTANSEGNFVLAANLTLTDNDMVVDTLMGVDVAITGNFMAGDDFLRVVGLPVGMDSSYDVMTGVLSITGEVPVDWYEYMLRQVTYSNRSMVRDGVARTISFTVHDGFTKGTAQSMTVQAEAVPVVEGGLKTLVYESGKVSEVIDADISVMYLGNRILTSATVAFTWDYNADQDRLVFTDMHGITGAFDEATGVLTLRGTTFVENYQEALRSLQYMNTRTNPIPGLRQLSLTIADGTKTSDVASLQISVDTDYVAPTIGIDSTDQAFTEGNDPIAVADTFTISQQDAAASDGRGTVMLNGAAITIEGYVPGEDVLSFTPFSFTSDANESNTDPDTVTIDGEFDAELGQLLLTGRATLEQYQTTIRSITYENVSEAPTTDPRVIHIMMQAGALDGEAPPVTITVTSLNNPPTQVSGPSAEATMLENAITGDLGLAFVEYAPPSDKEPDLVYTITAVPDETLGQIEFFDGTVAQIDTEYSLEQLRSAAFVPALNASGEGTLTYTVAGFNPILQQNDPAHLTESFDIKVNGIPTDNPSDAFVAQLHRDLLGRNATQEELDAFGNDQEFQVSRLSASETVQASREYRDLFVTSVYERLLSRSATTEELDAWSESDSISLGDVPSLNEVLPAVMSSDEYFTTRGADSYDLFVSSVFEDLMGRLPTDLELENEVGLLEDGVARSEVVTAIHDSDEASAIVVSNVIASLVRRTGGQFEVVDFARLLQDNGQQWLITHFAASDEYFLRYGIQESGDARSTEEVHADLVRQWLEGEATVGNSVVTSNFEATGTLAIDGRGRGGGTLIASEYVLTAAHLVNGRDAESLRFTVGGTSYGVSEVHVHDGYSLGFLGTDDGNDLAILRLNRPVVDVSPIELWQGRLQTGDELTLVGFGPHPGDEAFGTKRSGTTTVDGLSPRLVTWTYDNASEATTVPGDSGSPQLIVQDGIYYLASVASGGTHQALSLGDYAYNTRIDSYVSWISEVVGQTVHALGSSQGSDFEGQQSSELTTSFVAFNTDYNVELSGNDLLIRDFSTNGQDNSFVISTTATDVVISDAFQKMTTAIAGATGTATHTITVPLSAFTGNILIQSASGNDSIEVTTPSRLVDVDAGTGTNSLTINGSNGATAEEFLIRNSTISAGSLEVEMPGIAAPGPYTVRALNVANVTLNTGAGIDTVRPSDLSNLTAAPQTLTINLGDGDDVLAGENGTLGLIVNGDEGNDTLTGGAGNDRLNGGLLDDTLAGGPGDDVYVFDVDDIIGADTVTENANAGTDTLDFSSTQSATVGIDLRATAAVQTVDTNGNLQLTLSDEIENVIGGDNGNAIIGDDGANLLRGGDGIDFILGAGGDDQIFGGASRDTLQTTAAGAQLDGESGPDVTEFSGVDIAFPTNVPAIFEISGSSGSQYDQVRVFGDSRTVTLGSADLQLVLGNHTLQVNDTFTIVNLVASTSTISGTFNHGGQALAEGATFVEAGRQFRISYLGGSGNDVVLTFLQRLPGITVTPSSIVPTVTEAGSTETFDVVLDIQPASDVVINITSSDTTEATVDKATITFTNANWDTPQTVTITGIDDTDVDGNQSSTITLSIDDATSDNAYDNVTDQTVGVTTIDDDVASPPFFVTGPIGNTQNIRPTVSWTPVTGALSYNVYLNIDNNGGTVFTQRNVSSSQTSLVIPQDLEFARYRVFIEANMPNSVVTKQDQGHTFVVDVKPQLIPIGATLETNPVFTWNRVPGASSYQIFINVPGNPIRATVTPTGGASTVSMMSATSLAANDYKWWVRPVRQVNGTDYLGPWSDSSEFSTGGRTKVTSPTRNSTVTEAVPTLIWPAVPNAQSYEVYVSKVGTPGVLYRDAGITANSIRTRILQNGDYNVWIRTTLANGSKIWGNGVPFSVNATSTSLQTTPQSPTNPTFNTTPILFSWQATSGADSYDLYLHRGTSSILETGITGTTWTPSPVLANDSWTWSVRPVNSSGVGLFSTPVALNLEGRTEVLTPGATTSDRTPEFTWIPVGNAVTYEIQVNNQTTATANVIRETGLTGTSFTPTTDLPAGEFRVWVRAISSTSTGPWSILKEFTVADADLKESSDLSQSLFAALRHPIESVSETVEWEDVSHHDKPTHSPTEQHPASTPEQPPVTASGEPFELDQEFQNAMDWLSSV
ncbi:MAG: choice-of-anchor Q domain-containing protein [Fuerstiella sp.]